MLQSTMLLLGRSLLCDGPALQCMADQPSRHLPPAPVSLSSCCIFSYSHWGDASMQERARGYKKKNFIQAKYDFIDEMFKWSGSATPEKVSRGGGSVDPGVLARCAF